MQRRPLKRIAYWPVVQIGLLERIAYGPVVQSRPLKRIAYWPVVHSGPLVSKQFFQGDIQSLLESIAIIVYQLPNISQYVDIKVEME